MHSQREEEEIIPEDSTSTRVSSTHSIINSLKVLVLVHTGTLTKEDVVMNHNEPQGFEEAF